VSYLAGLTGAKITLLHAVQVLTGPTEDAVLGTPIGPPDYESETKAAEEALEAQAKFLSPDREVSLRVVRHRQVAGAIVDTAKEIGADLIALSTHGRSGLRRLVLGSVTEEVLRHSPVPVLASPQRESAGGQVGFDLDHLLLTTDLSDEALRPFPPVLEAAKTLGCRVTVLHVVSEHRAIPYGAPLAPPVTPPGASQQVEDARTSVVEQCSTLGNGVDLNIEVVRHESPAEGIVEYARKEGVDLIALSTHGRSGVRRLALGSVAEQVLRHSSVPVLSFHRPEG
jgi:nucleotide-binding universal stress UspA family protein